MICGTPTDKCWDIGVPLQPSNKKKWEHMETLYFFNSQRIQCVHLYSVMQQGSAMLNSCIRARQAIWTLALIHWHLCQAIWDLDISLEMWPFSMTVQPHTAHIKHESGYSHFRGNLWTIHPIVLDFAPVGLSFIWATEAALGTLLIPQ